jgi:hypothetical protein
MHEGRQALILGAEAVDAPGSDARPGERRLAGVHEVLRELVHAVLGRHAADHAKLVDHAGHVRQEIAHLDPRLAVLGELERAAHELAGEAAHPLGGLGRLGEVFLRHLVDRPVVVFDQLRLGVERVDLRGAAFGEDVDHMLRPRPELMAGPRSRLVAK